VATKVLIRQYRDKIAQMKDELDAKDAELRAEAQRVAELADRLADAEVGPRAFIELRSHRSGPG
jgi:hypothetical protein